MLGELRPPPISHLTCCRTFTDHPLHSSLIETVLNSNRNDIRCRPRSHIVENRSLVDSYKTCLSAGRCRMWRTRRSPRVIRATSSTTAARLATSRRPATQDPVAAAPGPSSLDTMGTQPQQEHISSVPTFSVSSVSENLQFCKMTVISPSEFSTSSVLFQPLVIFLQDEIKTRQFHLFLPGSKTTCRASGRKTRRPTSFLLCPSSVRVAHLKRKWTVCKRIFQS